MGPAECACPPDGRYLAFDAPPDSESLNTDVFVMPASGGRPVPVVTGPHDDRRLDWTPDGRRVLVASNRSGGYDAWLMQVDGGSAESSPLLLRKDVGMVFPTGFSPDGSHYLALDLGVRDVVLVDWNVESQKAASAPVPATEHFSGSTPLPAWSPDGRKLGCLVDHGFLRPAEARLRIHDMETGAERTLVDVSGSVYNLSWSPDGTSVAMTVAMAQPASACRILDVTSGKLIRQFAGPRMGCGVCEFVLSPEGDVVYCVAVAPGGRTTLLRHDLRTGDEVTLYTGGVGVLIDIAVSPDGRHVAVARAQRVILIAATGGEPHELVSEALGRRAADTLNRRPRFGIATSSGAGPVRGVSICPRVTFACPRCVLRQAQDALSMPKGGQMASTSATHALRVTTQNRGLSFSLICRWEHAYVSRQLPELQGAIK